MASANLYASIKEAKTYGINVDMSAVSVDFKAIDKRKNAVINGLGFGLEAMLWKKSRGIDVIKGPRAAFGCAHHRGGQRQGEKDRDGGKHRRRRGLGARGDSGLQRGHKKVITSNEIMDFSARCRGASS